MLQIVECAVWVWTVPYLGNARQNPRGSFVKAVNVENLVVRATFGHVEEGRAESLSEDVGNLEDDDVDATQVLNKYLSAEFNHPLL
jgi:hypothetical protein